MLVIIVKPERTGFVEVMTEVREGEEGLILVGTGRIVNNEDGSEDKTRGNDSPLVLAD